MKKEDYEMMRELAKAHHDNDMEGKRVESEKDGFAKNLKEGLGAEMKAVLSEKQEMEIKRQKENKIKKIFRRLIEICQY